LALTTVQIARVPADIGAIAIGRNEGDRLKACLKSLSVAGTVVYVDSGSTDGSPQWATSHGANVVQLDTIHPFTAARARNAGFQHLKQIKPDIKYVQFVDGDCEVDKAWLVASSSFLDSHPNVGAVCGRRRERFPEKSIYNWLCDREWEGRAGEVRSCGGDVMIRTSALEPLGGYREDMIAGEDPELCVRLRAAGWRVWRLDAEMTLHDAALTRFGQWWKRITRSGYAFALGAYLHGRSRERHWVWESRRAWLWGFWLPIGCFASGFAFSPWGWTTFLIFPAQIVRQTIRNKGSLKERLNLAVFQLLMRFPEVVGQLKFLRDRLLGVRSQLIEYK
jgi:glycosyltransferase involved in cell wall biosynthesis